MPDEIGYQSTSGGLISWASLVEETHETNPDLMWPQSIDVFDRMRSEDSQVMSVLRAVMQPILSTEWVIDPAGARDEVVEHIAIDFGLPVKGQDPVAPLRTRGRFSWQEYLRLSLLSLPFGYSYFEQVYALEGERLHLRKLAWRPPRTIGEVQVAKDGGLVAIVQHGVGGGLGNVTIPVDRLVAHVNEREGANWLGRSVLRAAYKNWLLKDRLLRVQALAAERNGLGIPMYVGAPPPASADIVEAMAWADSEIKAGLKIAKELRAGDSAGASIPHGAQLTLQGVTGKLPDVDPMIRYQDEQIARAVLAHVLNLGGDNSTGSYALSDTLADILVNSLNAIALQIAEVTQQHVVEDLVDRNWGFTEPAPRIVPTQIGSKQPVTAESIRTLVECGALTADPSLEKYLRTALGLPAIAAKVDDTQARSDAEQARYAAEAAQKVYLAVDKVLDQEEARDIVRRAGANLKDAPDITTEEAAA